MLKPIKICHFTSVHPASDTRIFVKECVSLAKAGFEVYLVAVDTASEVRDKVTVINVPSVGSGRLMRMMFTTRKVYQAAKKLDADIYHFHDPELIPFGIKLIRKGKKVIYDVHEDIPRQVLAKYYIPAFLRKMISRWLESYEDNAASKFSHIITATPFIRDRFLKYTKSVTAICNFPLAGELNSSVLLKTRPLALCYVGSITRERGIVELVTAMETLNYQLHLCGKFSPARLRDEVMQLPGWKKVVEHGYASRELIQKVLEGSRIGMVTLHPITNYIDAYPVKLFEYMMAGIPVIASDIPLWKEIVVGNGAGLCADPLDPEAIRKAIISIMENEDLAVQMGEAGKRAVANRYNWSQEAEKLAGVYRQLTGV